MKRSKSIKGTAIGFEIFAFVVFAAWVALFIFIGVGLGALKDFAIVHLTRLWDTILFKNSAYLINTIGVYVALGVALLLLLVTIIVSIIKKRGLALLPTLAVLLGAFAVSEFLASLHGSLAGAEFTNTFGYAWLIKASAGDIKTLVIVYALLGTAALSVLLALLSWLFAFIHVVAFKREKDVLADDAIPEKEVKSEEEFEDDLKELPDPEYSPEPPVADEVKSCDDRIIPIPVPVEGAKEDREGLKADLRELVREIIRDELEKNKTPLPTSSNNNNVTGANFSSPVVVQYFYGYPAPCQKEEPKEEVKEEPKEEPAPVEEVKEEPVPEVVEEVKEEPAPVAEEVKEEPVVLDPVPVVEEVKEEPAKPLIVRIPFTDRITNAEQEIKDLYNELKNEIMSYGMHSRVSNSGDTFRLHCKTYIKMTIAGKSLKLYFALNPEDYEDSKLPIKDVGDKNIYADIPLVFKVRSPLSVKRCKQLIKDVMSKDNLEQGEVGNIDYVSRIQEDLAANKEADDEACDEE